MMKISAIVVGLIAIISMTGCRPVPMGQTAPPKKERAEYDCRKHAPDKVCEIPWKDKTVLYCYKGTIPRVVRFREECK